MSHRQKGKHKARHHARATVFNVLPKPVVAAAVAEPLVAAAPTDELATPVLAAVGAEEGDN